MLKFAILLAAVAVCNGQGTNQYFLYTRANPTVPETLPGTGVWAVDAVTNFNPELKTLILVHGHEGDAGASFNLKIKSEILASDIQDPFNVIVVDWGQEAKQSYAIASGSVVNVARRLSNFLVWLKEQRPLLSVGDLHLVGFGLGAHVVGMAARQLPVALGKVGRITGLDPAGRRWGSNSGRLDDGDATYVEVIHTDGSGLLAYGIGTGIGRINFYVNGGSNQPGCFSHSCSHERAWDLFAASMSNTRLVGYPCRTYTQNNLNLCKGFPMLMGGTELLKRGDSKVYRINTSRSWPYK